MNDKLPSGFEELTPVLIDRAITRAEMTLLSSLLTAQEAKDIRDDIARLRVVDPRGAADHGPIILSLHRLDKIAQRIEASERKNAQAKLARVGKKTKMDERNIELDAAIKAEAEHLRKALATSMEFANLIRPGVRKRLGLTPEGEDWPSASAIKVAIRRIKSVKASKS